MFMPTGPNVKNNPMLTRTCPSVSTIEESDNLESIIMVEEIRTPMLVIREQLVKHGLIPANHDKCEYCVSGPGTCDRLKGCV